MLCPFAKLGGVRLSHEFFTPPQPSPGKGEGVRNVLLILIPQPGQPQPANFLIKLF